MDKVNLQVGQFLNSLTEIGLNFVVAGGYPRDIILCNEPKDLDICVLVQDDDEANVKINNALWRLLKHNMGVDFDIYSSGEEESGAEYDDPDIEEVWKVTSETILGVGVDFIFYHDHIREEKELIEVFDCNFSQYVLRQEGGHWYPYFAGKSAGTWEQVNPQVSETRLTYIKEKAAKYGWKV